MESLWEKLGLADNPYDSRPLELNDKDSKLFVGRDKELKQLNTLVSASKGGLIIIEGEAGVGKTSFVNVFQYTKWKKEKFLPTFERIELSENTNAINFMLSILSNLIFNLEKIIDNKILNKHQIYQDSKSFVAKSIEHGWGASLSVVGTGGGLSRQKTVTQPPLLVLPTIIDTLDKLINFVIQKIGLNSIIIPIDNFDIVSETNIIDFLNTMRDTIIGRKNIWWIIIGQKGLLSLIEKKAHRVSEIITGKPIIIEPMSLPDVNQMIQLRYQNLKISKTVQEIVPNEVIDILYDVSKGEARYILKRTTDLVYSFITEFPSEKKIPINIAKKMIYSESKKRIDEAELTERQIEMLKKMAEVGSFQSKDFKKFGLKSAQAVVKYIDKFQSQNFLVKKETTGKAVYYRTTGDVNIFFNRELLNH